MEYSVMEVAEILIHKIKGADAKIEDWIEYIEALAKLRVAGKYIDLGDLSVKMGNKETKGAAEVIRNAILSEDKTRS